MSEKLSGGKSGYVLAPSILSADFSKLGEDIEAIKDAEYVHVDVMDGTFVPNISFGAAVMKSIRNRSNQIFDVHMMVEEPVRYIDDFKKAGADLICVHVEACKHLDRTLAAIREAGCKVGVALNPATSIETVRWVLDKVDMILLMSVNPGFGGQSYIPIITKKIRACYDMIKENGLEGLIDIEVDGGVKLSNVEEVLSAGANVIVVGSAVYGGNPAENIAAFHKVFESYK